jgi:hypothetical protein
MKNLATDKYTLIFSQGISDNEKSLKGYPYFLSLTNGQSKLECLLSFSG